MTTAPVDHRWKILITKPEWHSKVLRICRSLPFQQNPDNLSKKTFWTPYFEKHFEYTGRDDEKKKDDLVSVMSTQPANRVFFNSTRGHRYLPESFPRTSHFYTISKMLSMIHSNIPTWSVEPQTSFHRFLYYCLQSDMRNALEDTSLIRKVQGLIEHVKSFINEHESKDPDFDTEMDSLVKFHGLRYLADLVYKNYYCAGEALLPDDFYRIVGYIYTLCEKTGYTVHFEKQTPPPYAPSTTQSPAAFTKKGDIVFAEASAPPPEYTPSSETADVSRRFTRR